MRYQIYKEFSVLLAVMKFTGIAKKKKELIPNVEKHYIYFILFVIASFTKSEFLENILLPHEEKQY